LFEEYTGTSTRSNFNRRGPAGFPARLIEAARSHHGVTEGRRERSDRNIRRNCALRKVFSLTEDSDTTISRKIYVEPV
jgi:hypothetical protein